MGTKVHFESCFPEYFSMKDISEDSNGCSWPLNYGDRTFANGQYYNGFFPRAIADAYAGHDKDVVKQRMLEHEAIFKDQLYELHRLYKIQRELMEDIKRKELHKNQIPIEVSLSSSPLASQITSEDARKWHIPRFPLANSFCARQSTSGIEDIHSPLSSMKGSSLQGGPLPSQDGCTSKDVEILETRPTKVRKLMFDLRLPADEDIDTEETEHLRDDKLSGISSFLSNKNHKIALECRRNLFPVDVCKSNCQGDALRSDSFSRNKNSVTDLNEPVEAEEINASAYVDLLGCNSSSGQVQKQEVAAQSKSQLLGFSRSIPLNADHGSENGTLHNTSSQINPNGKWFFPQMIGAVNSNNLKSTPQGLVREKLAASSQPMQPMFHKTYESPNFVQGGQGKVDQLRERMVHGPELSERNREVCNGSHPESFVVSRNSPCLIAAPNLRKSWSNSVSSWEKSSGILSQGSMSAQTQAFLNSSATLSSSQSSNQSHEVFGDRWNYNISSAFNPMFQSEMPIQNGFYHGSSSGSKELPVCLPSGNCNYLNGSAANSERLINQGSAKSCKSSNCMDLNTAEDVSLNAVPSNSSSNKQTLQPGLAIIDVEKMPEDKPATLPWLRARPACKNEVTNAMVDLNTVEISSLKSSLSHFSNANETERVTDRFGTRNMKSNSCSDALETGAEMSRSSSCRKILGFPIFEKPSVFKKESSSFTSPSVSQPQPLEEVNNKRKVKVLDINLPCDPAFPPDLGLQTVAEVIEKETDAKVAHMRHKFDLNSCMTEDEASVVPSVPGFNLKIVSGNDLKAPIDLETEEDVIPGKECPEKMHEVPLWLPQCKAESLQDEVVMMAAEAMVAISTSGACILLNDATCNASESSMTDPLHWFVDIASSCGEDLESRFDKASRGKDGEEKERSSPEAIDYFESMTLNLTETKEEDYMPKPLVPENLNLEEMGNTPLPTRTRKGQARRGRQRRDFQRDILPGLASLSRHEVTEDLQTFGGLMRTTGHPWHSGLMRRNTTRNGGARGRRRTRISSSPPVTALPPCTPLIQQLNNIEVGLEDRSLTGWGKTTRRPRRQRCPAGNPPPVLLT
uniref:Uncharacterized protein LOC105121218 n=1 Tax=Rhizophora mucronata TaxID=61149 RepID=A0A2P2MGS2_RHIMU